MKCENKEKEKKKIRSPSKNIVPKRFSVNMMIGIECHAGELREKILPSTFV